MTWLDCSEFERELMTTAAKIRHSRNVATMYPPDIILPLTKPKIAEVFGIPVVSDRTVPMGEIRIENECIVTNEDSILMYTSEMIRSGRLKNNDT